MTSGSDTSGGWAPRLVPAHARSGRDIGEPRLSPDGTVLAYVSATNGRASIAVVPVAGGPERVLTSEPPPRSPRGFDGGVFDWLPDGSGIVYVGAGGGLWLQTLAPGAAREVAPAEPDRPASGPAVSPDGTLVAWAVDMAQIHAGRIPGPGERAVTPVIVPGSGEFVVDPAWHPSGEALVWHEWDPPAMAWDESRIGVSRIGVAADGQPTCTRAEVLRGGPAAQRQQPRFDAGGSLLLVEDGTGWLNVSCEDGPVLSEPNEHAGPTWGPGQRSFAPSPDGRYVAVARNEAGFGRLVVVDRSTGAVHELGRGVHGQIGWRGGFVAALRSGACTPTEVVLYEAPPGSGERRSVAVGPVAAYDRSVLREPTPWSAVSRDGERLHARWYVPPESSGSRSRGVLCWIHGGPTDQWQVTFNARIAMWADAGWSVLVPDPRGSTGHGRDYQQALRGRWGELDVADVVDLLRSAAPELGVVPARTVVVGGSAGGLTALGVVIAAPELVAGAVTAYPVADLDALDRTTHRFEAHYCRTLLGPRSVVAAIGRERSPVHLADRIRRPVLLLHGTDDPVVPIDQSRALRDAVVLAGGSIELVEYEGEGHGFRRAETVADEHRRMSALLDRLVP